MVFGGFLALTSHIGGVTQWASTRPGTVSTETDGNNLEVRCAESTEQPARVRHVRVAITRSNMARVERVVLCTRVLASVSESKSATQSSSLTQWDENTYGGWITESTTGTTFRASTFLSLKPSLQACGRSPHHRATGTRASKPMRSASCAIFFDCSQVTRKSVGERSSPFRRCS